MKKRIVLYKGMDRIAGPILVSIARLGTRPRNRVVPLLPSKVLFIRPGGIGDAVLLIPTIRAVKRRYPAAAIHVLAEKRNAEVFLLCPDIEGVFHYDRPTELISVIRGSYDVVIDTEQWHRLSAVVSRLVRAPISIGFATNERKKLFSHQIPYSHDDHEVDSFLHLIEPLSKETSFDHAQPFLAVPEGYHTSVEPYIQPRSNRKIIALFPGGSIVERRWGSERFHIVAKRLLEMDYGIIVVGGKEDIRDGEEIIQNLPNSLNICGKLSLRETAAVLKESSLLITGDSGIMHLGYAVGTKVLALFGPGIEKKWAPRSLRVAILNKHLPCSPCTKYGYTPKCRREAACMKEISADKVIESAMALLEKD